MQLRDIGKPVTSKALNESLAKKFGYKLNLEQFTDIQLEDVRNKLRTEISQFECNESYDSVLENPKYQKTRALLDVINQAISEREMTSGEKSKETTLKKKYDPSGMKKSMKKQYGADKGKQIYFATIRKRAMDHSVPESWISSALNRIELGESDKRELSAELRLRYDLTESQASWVLLESEERKAENIINTKDMVDQVTNWLEDVATLRSESLLDLLDSIREQQGSDVSQRYANIVKPALDGLYSSLEKTRNGLSQALAVLTNQEGATMGAPAGGEIGGPDMGMGEPDMGGDIGSPDMSAAPELGMETPPAPEAERLKREGVEYSRRLAALLTSKKK